jgi:predicted transcriptional regulator
MKKNQDVCSILLTRRELQIMSVIWKEGSATVRQVCEALSMRKTLAYTTILTFMSILEKKGALIHTKSGRAYIYRPILSREQATKNHVQDVIACFFDGCPEKLVADIMASEIKTQETFRNTRDHMKSWPANEVA